jgi:transcription elongation factor Elf1
MSDINKLPGAYEEIDIRCPRCNSDRITVCEDPQGHFQVTECANCGYTKECTLKDME